MVENTFLGFKNFEYSSLVHPLMHPCFFFKLTFECVQTTRTINKLEEINQLAEDVKSRIEKLGREIETAPIQSQRIEMAYMERSCLFEVLNRM